VWTLPHLIDTVRRVHTQVLTLKIMFCTTCEGAKKMGLTLARPVIIIYHLPRGMGWSFG
jgi:hypothetical protein